MTPKMKQGILFGIKKKFLVAVKYLGFGGEWYFRFLRKTPSKDFCFDSRLPPPPIYPPNSELHDSTIFTWIQDNFEFTMAFQQLDYIHEKSINLL